MKNHDLGKSTFKLCMDRNIYKFNKGVEISRDRRNNSFLVIHVTLNDIFLNEIRGQIGLIVSGLNSQRKQ